MSKRAGLLLLLVLTTSGLVQIMLAQGAIPKPSVPEFAVKYVDYSYDIPPTYEIDQFTGQNVTKREGEHIDNRSAVFTIRNQPFTTYVDSGNNTIGLYYNFRYKGHFGSDWGYFPFSESGQSWRYHATFIVFIDVPPDKFSSASNSEYTETLLRLPFLFGYGNPPMNTQVDFQVQALIGHIDYEGDGYYRFTGERSDWSNTQTIAIGGSTPTATPSPSPSQSTSTPNDSASPSQNPTAELSNNPSCVLFGLSGEQTALAVLCVLAVILVIADLVVHFKKRSGGQPA